MTNLLTKLSTGLWRGQRTMTGDCITDCGQALWLRPTAAVGPKRRRGVGVVGCIGAARGSTRLSTARRRPADESLFRPCCGRGQPGAARRGDRRSHEVPAVRQRSEPQPAECVILLCVCQCVNTDGLRRPGINPTQVCVTPPVAMTCVSICQQRLGRRPATPGQQSGDLVRQAGGALYRPEQHTASLSSAKWYRRSDIHSDRRQTRRHSARNDGPPRRDPDDSTAEQATQTGKQRGTPTRTYTSGWDRTMNMCLTQTCGVPPESFENYSVYHFSYSLMVLICLFVLGFRVI